MILQETAFVSVLLLFCLAENAQGASWQTRISTALSVVALPVFGWVHAVSWFYNLPLNQARGLFHLPWVVQSFSALCILLATVHAVMPWWAARSKHVLVHRLNSIINKVPSLGGLFMVYPVAAMLYPSFVSWGAMGMAAFGVAAITLTGWLFVLLWKKAMDRDAVLALRPFLIFIQWLLFLHLNP